MAIYNIGQGGGSPRGYCHKIESTYTTTTKNESTIPINISGFKTTDVLFVDINGLDLIEGLDYAINGVNITLTTPIAVRGTVVHFVVIRMIEIDIGDIDELKGEDGKIEIVRW